MIPKDTKPCELCRHPRIKGQRFCPRHRTEQLKAWRAAGKMGLEPIAPNQDRLDRQRYGDSSLDRI